MIIMVHSAFDAGSVAASLGAPEYSYWFVRRAFWPHLEHFGIVVPVTDPRREVDIIRASAAARGEPSVFFSFEPPHKTPLGLTCRTIPVFAWEFDAIPHEVWDGEPRNDWRRVLTETGSAVTHCRFTAATVRAALGADYKVWSIPAPSYEANAPFAAGARGYQPETDIAISGIAIDAGRINTDLFLPRQLFDQGVHALHSLARYLATPGRAPQQLRISGVVYTAVLNPVDGRKNCSDLLGAFIWAFRGVEDATLLLKLTHHDTVRALQPVLAEIAKHGAFRCRVLLIHGMLPDEEYRALLALTSFTVNASTNEGQCLPLMEFMSAGRPAIAPAHTAMLDYLREDNAFCVRYASAPVPWPHDSRHALRTHRYVVSVADLIRAYRESYNVAVSDPARYAAMSRAATEALREFCGAAIVRERLADVIAAPVNPLLRGADADRAILVEG